MKRYLKIFTFTAFLIVTSVGMAQAQEFTQEGAQEIKTELNEWLDRQMSLLSFTAAGEAENAMGLERSGDLTVTPENGYYAAKLPFITYNMGETGRFEIGQIAANIIPSDDNKWRITVSYPKTMDFYDADGSALFTLSIGKQRFGGVWDVEKNIYVQYEGAYEDIEVRDTLKRFGSMKIENIKMMQNFQPNAGAPNLYSGPLNFELNGMTINVEDKAKNQSLKVSVGNIYSKNMYNDMELMDAKAIEEGMKQFIEDPKANMDTYVSSLAGVMAAMPNSGTSQTVVTDMSFAMFQNGKVQDDFSEKIKGERKVTVTKERKFSFSADRFEYTAKLDGFKSDVGSFGFAYDFDGLQVDDMPDQYSQYVPQSVTLDMTFDDIPMKKLGELIHAALSQAANEESGKTQTQRQEMMMATFMALPQLLTQEGTSLTIDNTKLVSAALQTSLKGQAQANPNAAKLATGEFTLKIKGLNKTIQSIQSTMGENPEMAQKMQGALMGLTMAQSMGQLDADGETRVYKFTITEDGKMLLNGSDMQGLMGSQAH